MEEDKIVQPKDYVWFTKIELSDCSAILRKSFLRDNYLILEHPLRKTKMEITKEDLVNMAELLGLEVVL